MHDAIRVTMEFLLTFDETNFVEVLKIREIYGPRNKGALQYAVCVVPYGRSKLQEEIIIYKSFEFEYLQFLNTLQQEI